MKNQLILFAAILFSAKSIAQVGISTENPQTIFHVDGGKNNPSAGAPSATQQLDDFTVTAQGQVGIGINLPTAQLQTTGNMILGTAVLTNGANGYGILVRDNFSGELKTASSNSGNTAIFNNVTFQLNDVEGDFINDFNTNINSSQYTVIVTGSSFTPATANTGLTNQSTGDFAPKNIYAYQNGGTWRLFADYRGANTADALNGSWTINCMVLNNTFVNSLGTVTATLGGTPNGSAPAPAGL